MKRYKFLLKGLRSANGDMKWKVGKWYKYDGDIEMCQRGFHCSKGIHQAFSYVQGDILAEVEVKGNHQSQDDKDVWQEMRLTKVWKWKKKDSVLFSIYAARLVLHIFEEKYPNDKRPREAIEAAEKWVKNPTKKNKNAAANAAYAAYVATNAAYAAHVAANAAYVATNAAYVAAHAANAAANAAYVAVHVANAAANAAYVAAHVAANAARAANAAAVYKKLDRWMLKHLPELEEL